MNFWDDTDLGSIYDSPPIQVADPDTHRNLAEEKKEEEQLPGYIDGEKVTDIEARYILAAKENRQVDRVQIQVSFVAGRNLPGEIRLDAILHAGGIMFPVFLDEAYWHRSSEQRDKDKQQSDEINRRLQGTTAFPVQRIPGDDLRTMEDARQSVENTLKGIYLAKEG